MVNAILLTKYIGRAADFCEWTEHHLALGIHHIYVYDNGVPFDLCTACAKYGLRVSYHRVNGRVCQFDIYERCIKNSDADYLMPIDDDEYLWIDSEFKTIDKVIEHYGNPDCLGIRWKYMFPKRFSRVRNIPVLKYCTEQNPDAAKLFCAGGDKLVKCIVKRDEFVRYKTADEDTYRCHIPVTKSNKGALLCDGTRTLTDKVKDNGNEPIRLLHCPYKGYDEFLHTRGRDRYAVCRRKPMIRRGRFIFLKWIEAQYG